MTTFALIHGGAHGGWCWDDVVPLLRAEGHSTVAPDVPMGDPSLGAREWAQVVADAIGDATDVVAVAHSLGGMLLPVLASLRPLRRMVFVGAQVPLPGAVYYEYLATQQEAITLTRDRLIFDEQGRSIVDWETALEFFYADCALESARRAFERLRPVAPTVFLEQCPIDTWPDTPSSYILGTEDRAVGPAWSRRVCAERLGCVPIELPTSHSPFMSRPAEFVEALLAAV